MKLWHGIFHARKDLESSFHCYVGYVKLVHVSLNVRKDIEMNVHNCGGPAKLILASYPGSRWAG